MTISIIDPDNGSPTPDYTDAKTWSNADRDLVTATDTEEGEIRPTSGSACIVTNAEIEWNGYTTNRTYYIEMRAHVDHKHSGKVEASPSYARLDIDSSTNWHAINVTAIVDIKNLELTRQGVATAQKLYQARQDGVLRELSGCLLHAPVSGEVCERAVNPSGTGTLLLDIVNNVITGYFSLNGVRAFFTGQHWDGGFYNNTIQPNCTSDAVDIPEGATYRGPDTKNNFIENQGTGPDYDDGSRVLTTNTNYTSDATSPDGASYQNETATYEDQANYDLHLASGDDGSFEGTDLSSDSVYAFSIDIDDDTRADWDAGADEFIAAGLAVQYLVNLNQRNMTPLIQM